MEHWLPVVGLEGFYEVSDMGRVRTVERTVRAKLGSVRTIRSRIRKHSFLRSYPAVHMSALGKSHMRTIHTLMLEAFVGPRPSSLHEACHEDDQPENNWLGNLRWDTKKANKADAFRNGRAPHGERVGNSKLTLNQVLRLQRDPRGSRPIASELGVDASTVKRARNGATWSRALGGAT